MSAITTEPAPRCARRRAVPAGARLAATAVLALLAGCRVPAVRRDAEIGRFDAAMAARQAADGVAVAVPLSMERCVEIALARNLDQRVRALQLSLADDRVRQALADGLPSASVAFSDTRRNNEPLVSFGGGSPVQMEDQDMQSVTVQGVIPILDWGTTYYAWTIARDRRHQERLLLERSRQALTRDVRCAYVRLASAQREERLARVATLAAGELLKVARSLEREGLQAKAATAEVEAGAALAALAWSSARRSVEQTHLALARLLSLPPGADFAVMDTEPPPRPIVAAAAIARLEQGALERRPELQVQDLQRHIAAGTVRQRLAEFFPHVDALPSYNWSSLSTAVNPGYWRFGVQVSDSLLNGGRNLADLRLAKKDVSVEEERTLLLTLGVLYEVDFRVLQLYALHDTVLARQALVTARTEALRMVVSRYVQGLESGSDAVRTLAETYSARIDLDRARTEYQAAGFELDAAALSDAAHGVGQTAAPDQAGAPPARPSDLPPFQPAPVLDSYPTLLDAAPAVDLSQFPDLQELMKYGKLPR